MRSSVPEQSQEHAQAQSYHEQDRHRATDQAIVEAKRRLGVRLLRRPPLAVEALAVASVARVLGFPVPLRMRGAGNRADVVARSVALGTSRHRALPRCAAELSCFTVGFGAAGGKKTGFRS